MEDKNKEIKTESKVEKKDNNNNNNNKIKQMLIFALLIIIILTGIVFAIRTKVLEKRRYYMPRENNKSKQTVNIDKYRLNPENINKMQKELDKKKQRRK